MAITSTSDDPITGIIIPANTTGTANSETITVTFSVTNKAMPASLEGFTINVNLESAGEGYTVNMSNTINSALDDAVPVAYYIVNGANKYDINFNQSIVLEGVRTIQFFGMTSTITNIVSIDISFNPTIYSDYSFALGYNQETSSQVFNITQNLTISLSFEYGANAGGGIIE